MPHRTIEARREYHREWIAAHPGHGARASAKRRLLHPGFARAEYLKHKEAYVARSKRWQAANPEKAKASKRKALLKVRFEKPEYCRALQNAWRKQNPDKVKAYQERAKPRKAVASRVWKKEHPEKLAIYKRKRTLAGKTAIQDHVRRARMYDVGREDCKAKVAELKRALFCRWCCIRLTPEIFNVDHIVPMSRGGHHKPDNLAATCKTCNLSKGNKLVSEWTWEAA